MDEKSQQIRTFFGKNLKKARKAKGLTQDDLGTLLNVRRTTISMYETGDSMPSHAIIASILQELDISRDELFENVKKLDVSDLSTQLVEEDSPDYSAKPKDLLSYLVMLDKNEQIPAEILSDLKTLTLKLYNDRSEEKEEFIKQLQKYNELRELVKIKLDLPI